AEGTLRIPRAIALSILILLTGLCCASAVRANGSAVARLVPGDRITVTVFGQPDLSGVFQVDGEGNIELPLIGAVPVRELTLRECENRIEVRLADGYLNRP